MFSAKVLMRSIMERDSIREELKCQIMSTVKELRKGEGRKKELKEVVCAAVTGVALQRIQQRKWKHKTAAQQMRGIKRWMEDRFPGISSLAMWRNTHEVLHKVGHAVDKAPILPMMKIRKVLKLLGTTRLRAVFWMALLTCSRIGNLDGWMVKKVMPYGIRVQAIQSKSTGKRTMAHLELMLYYWSEEMKEAIVGKLPTGMVMKKDVLKIAKVLRAEKIRRHSIRRTAVQVYLDCQTPVENIRAITGHKETQMVLEYASHFRPLVDRSKPYGMAISHAPLIWRKQNVEGKNLLQGAKGGTSTPPKSKSQLRSSHTK